MTKHEKELSYIRPADEMQGQERIAGTNYDFITTAGHGYLVVPNDDINYGIAKKIVSYGYTGKLAIYLEEDCETGEFLEKIKK